VGFGRASLVNETNGTSPINATFGSGRPQPGSGQPLDCPAGFLEINGTCSAVGFFVGMLVCSCLCVCCTCSALVEPEASVRYVTRRKQNVRGDWVEEEEPRNTISWKWKVGTGK
jgi:hypothetical protein